MNKRMTGRGFTLIEVVLVLVLLGILGAVAIPKYYDLEAKAQRDAARAYANQFCADVNGRIAQLLFEGKSCVDAQRDALIELNKKYFYDPSTPGVDKSNPNGMRILPPPETGYKNPTEITVLLKSGETETAPSSRDFARIIFSGNSPRSTPPRRGFSYATASSSQ